MVMSSVKGQSRHASPVPLAVHGCSGRKSTVTSLPLLRQEPNIGQHVQHLLVRQLSPPRMHRAEDDAVLDRAQQFLV